MKKLITYHGSNDTLIWLKELKGLKSDCELIVPISHEAVFVKGDAIAGSFAGGRYLLSEWCVGDGKLFTSSTSQVDCRVYFVKREGTYNIKWEFPALCIDDCKLNIPVQFNLGGAFGINIIDAKQFLSRMLTFTKKSTLEDVKSFFRERMLLHVRGELINALNTSGTSAVELCNKMMSVSKDIELSVRHLFESFGVCVVGFLLKKYELLSIGDKRVLEQEQKADTDSPAMTEKTDINSGTKANDDVQKVIPGESLYCSACGVDVPPLSLYCFKCGAKIVNN